MGKKNTSAAPADTSAEEAVAQPDAQSEEAVSKSKGKAEVSAVAVYEGTKIVRVYSQEMHGDDYKALAKQFVDKYPVRKYTTADYVEPATPAPMPEDTEFVQVLNPSNEVMRTFSLRDHGEGYRALAEQFVEKYAKRKYTLK